MNSEPVDTGRVRAARRLWWRAATLAALAGAFAAGTWYGVHREQSREPWARERLLSVALDSVRVNFLDSLPEKELMRRAVSGMLRELQDPYAALLENEGMNSYRGTLRGESQGLGLLLRVRGSSLLVRRVLPGSPAAQAGVQVGDRVTMVDGRQAVDAWSMPRPDVGVRDSGGHASDTIQLRLVRGTANDSLGVALLRAPWRISAVSAALIAGNRVGYARLASSASGSADELERAVEELIDRGARSLVLDLRGNTGGLFEEGVKAAALFLRRGDVVASLARRGVELQEKETVRSSRWPNLPIVLLVDGNTASSAEIVAAALRDHGRALLVGERTYGKAQVQRVVSINPELSLRLTTARWLPPSGVPIDRRQEAGGQVTGGLVPDILVSPAGRLDPAAVSPSLSPNMAQAVSERVDAAVDSAFAGGWSQSPVAELEQRLRSLLVQAMAGLVSDPSRRTALAGDATRVAVRRVLEMTRSDDALWSYAAYDDAVFRAALDVVAPGLSTVSVVDTASGAAIDGAAIDGAEGAARKTKSAGGKSTGAKAAMGATGASNPAGDEASLTRLESWVTRRFRGVLVSTLTDSGATGAASVAGTTRPPPRIDGAVRAGVRDTIVAVHFAGGPFAPAYASGASVRLADPSGSLTLLEGTVLARLEFRAPVAPQSTASGATAWRHAWVYLVTLPPRTAAAHSGGFAGWRVAATP